MLNEKQEMCITLMITTSKTQKQIAKQINVTEKTICDWKKDQEFKNEIKKQMNDNFGSLAIVAQKQLAKLLKTKNEKVKIQAIKDVLDRAGYKPKEEIEVSRSTNEITDEIDKYIQEKMMLHDK